MTHEVDYLHNFELPSLNSPDKTFYLDSSNTYPAHTCVTDARPKYIIMAEYLYSGYGDEFYLRLYDDTTQKEYLMGANYQSSTTTPFTEYNPGVISNVSDTGFSYTRPRGNASNAKYTYTVLWVYY